LVAQWPSAVSGLALDEYVNLLACETILTSRGGMLVAYDADLGRPTKSLKRARLRSPP
jgi:hypothetical protein